jgi:hypothetical protein
LPMPPSEGREFVGIIAGRISGVNQNRRAAE